MFGDERASAKEISLFLMRLQGHVSAVSDTMKLETPCVCALCSHSTPDFCKPHHYWVSGQTSTFSTISQSVHEIRRWSVHVRTCRGTQLMICIKHTATGSLTAHLCNFSTVRPAIPDIWKRGAHVRTRGCTPPMTCGKHFGNEPQHTHQI